MPISRIFIIFFVALLVPSLAYSKVGPHPNAPLVVIVEINSDYLKIQTLRDFRSKSHMQQVYDLGEFGCKLYNRIGVVLSESKSTEPFPITGYSPDERIVYPKTYLFACALP